MFNRDLQIVVFGASGDLAGLKLFPALFELTKNDLFKQKYEFVGYGRSEFKNEDFREKIAGGLIAKKVVREDKRDELDKKFLEKLSYFQGSYDNFDDFVRLLKKLDESNGNKEKLVIFYYSVPPEAFEKITVNLAKARKEANVGFEFRVVIEKPFGEDEKSARSLFKSVNSYFSPEEVYLLDHYLGKKPIRSISRLRLENAVVNNLLNGEFISNIQITATEQSGTGKRVGYFDKVGTIKDMIQSHIVQIIALITMDLPLNPSDESIAREKTSIVSALKFSGSVDDIVLGQYKSYKIENEETANSNTETFCALKLTLDKRKWYKIPIYIRTGKKIRNFETKIVIEFKKMEAETEIKKPNRLIFELRPNENIRLVLNDIELSSNIPCVGIEECLGDYSSLIYEICQGKKSSFLNFEEIASAWRLIDKVFEIIEKKKIEVEMYEDGSDGPNRQFEIIKKDDNNWV